ncbi:hypothetical protein G8770_19695 [Aestuariicella hydrocarbonica]|uniref:Uncharacterized protein n=1 Tax=Pseudomaricurvus hydrocarbonicus TaxID=1470433 RepID=A0A9E5MP00_9GAMM|nr:hypothetical protein [Aestuariicella hydrocarbonica]NHO67776.1 hypothetical protein [Aestuariicella hydrocarbonica]
MNSELDIINKLKESMRTSCDDAFYFSDNETQLIDAEYLLTVNAAKAIKELNHYFGTPYKICLENNTKKFASACTPLMANVKADNFLGYKSVIRTPSNTLRSGKIDIAIYTDRNSIDIPLCAIEVKGFNPCKTLVIEDLERNAEYFSLSSRTGDSILPFTVFIALHSYKGVWNDEKEQLNLSKVKKRYQSYIDGNEKLNSLSQSVEVFTIRRGILPDPEDPHIQKYGLQGDEDYLFIGAVVTTKKNLTSQSTRTQQNCAGV